MTPDLLPAAPVLPAAPPPQAAMGGSPLAAAMMGHTAPMQLQNPLGGVPLSTMASLMHQNALQSNDPQAPGMLDNIIGNLTNTYTGPSAQTLGGATAPSTVAGSPDYLQKVLGAAPQQFMP